MIELWVHHMDDPEVEEERFKNVTCVPHIGSVIETRRGRRVVVGLVYDIHNDNGSARVHVEVKRNF